MHDSPAAPRLPCPSVCTALRTCVHVCRLEIASPRPRFVCSRTDIGPDNDYTDTPATIAVDALFCLSFDISLIVDVEPDEASKLIGLIEMLIEDWYIARHRRQKSLAGVKQVGDAKDAARANVT